MSLQTATPLLLAIILPLTLTAVSPEEGRTAAQKLERISAGEMTPGETITLTQDEINSFLKYNYAGLLPEGVRDLNVQLVPDAGIVSGRADFSKFGQADDVGLRLLLMMLEGERTFVARVRYVSSAGMARADVDSLMVDGRELSGPILDWIVRNYVQTDMKGFALGEPAPLGNNLDQIRLESERVVVVAQRLQAQRQPVAK